MLCCGYTLLYTMGMERRMTKKEEVVSCVQRLAAAAPEKREVGVTTQELAEQLQMQRSNLSTLSTSWWQMGRWKSCRVVRCTTGR